MNQLRDLPWLWIGAAAALLVVLYLARRFWRGRGSGRGRGYGSGHGYGGGYGSDHGQGAGGGTSAPVGDQRALLTAANGVREALERQTREIQELRTFWSKRLDELNGRIAELPRVPVQLPRDGPEAGSGRGQGLEGGGSRGGYGGGGYGGGGYGAGGAFDAEMYGAGSLGASAPLAEPAWYPGPGDQPVEVRDGALILSRSLPPPAYVSATAAGQGRVYLNADVQLSEFSLPKWAEFFELRGAKPYAAYRTLRPAVVRWEEGMGRGDLIEKGVAEAI
jgi:hypothetical protein